jgi:hypothetical protein
MSGIDWDAVNVGDPDPTDHSIFEGEMCPEEYPGSTRTETAYCTREDDDHERHVAGDGYQVVAVWR